MDKPALLRKASLFEGLEEQDLHALAAKLTEHSFRAGQMIFHYGDEATAMFIVAEGYVNIHLPGEQSRRISLKDLARGQTAAASWRDHGAVIVVEDLATAASLVDRLAPEHLELVGPRAEALSPRIRHAGAIFLGAFTPEVVGDYVGGPNHVLPTGRAARYASGLGVMDFLKRTTLLGCDRSSFTALAPAAATLARAEGLEAHAIAVERRLRAQG